MKVTMLREDGDFGAPAIWFRVWPWLKHMLLLTLAVQFFFAGATALVGSGQLPTMRSWTYWAWLILTMIGAELWPCSARSKLNLPTLKMPPFRFVVACAVGWVLGSLAMHLYLNW